MSEVLSKLLIDSGHRTKTVDEWLDSVDYRKDENYIPSLFALEMINFIKLVNGVEGEENKTPVLHMKILDEIFSEDINIANLVYRGAAKSTLMEYLIFYIAVYGELPKFGTVSFILYVSDSIENGVKTMRKSLEYRWENSDFLKKYLPRSRFTDVRWDFWSLSGNKTTIRGFGAKTGIRGTREGGKRPQLALLDDLISDDDARSPTVIAAIEDTVYKAVDYALHPSHRKVIWNGTPFNQLDPLYRAIESGAWKVNVFPVCNHFDETTTAETFVGAWPDRHTFKYVKGQYDKAKLAGKIESFMQELMLRISSDEDRLIDDKDISWFKGEDIKKRQYNYNFYITTDFATSEKKKADYSVISCWAYNSNEDWMLIDGYIGKTLMDKNIDVLFDMVVRYDAKSVGVEITGQQGAFVDWIKKEMHRRNIYFTIIEVRPTSDKLIRLHNMVPLFRRGKIWFNKELIGTPYMVEALNELKRVAIGGFKSAHDDFCDTLSMLSEMKPWRPAQMKDNDIFYENPFSDDWQEERNELESYIV